MFGHKNPSSRFFSKQKKRQSSWQECFTTSADDDWGDRLFYRDEQ